MENIETLLLGPLFPFLFAGMWCFVLFMLSKQSGWSRLAEIFECKERIEGKYYRFQSARINKVQFSSALEMGINELGLLLVPFLPFRLFHKRLLIPWEYISAKPFKKFFSSGYRLTISEDRNVQIEVTKRQFDRMSHYLNSNQ